MISNQEHEEFLKTIDESIKLLMSQDVLDDSKSNIEYCAQAFFVKRYKKEPKQSVWVKQGNSPITEFYSSELMIPWLVTYMKYYNNFLKDIDIEDGELGDIYKTCLYLSFVLTKIKGINIVDDTIYLLENDLEFVQYKLDQKLFI
jgi:hypothetical protein